MLSYKCMFLDRIIKTTSKIKKLGVRNVIKRDPYQISQAPSPSAIYTRDECGMEHPIILPILYLGTKGHCADFKDLTGRGRERESGTITESSRQDAHQKTLR